MSAAEIALDAPSKSKLSRSTGIAGACVAFFGWLAYIGPFPALALKTLTELEFLALGGSLLTAAIIIERVVEIFVATDRGNGAALLDHDINLRLGQLSAARAAGDAVAEQRLAAEHSALERQRAAYRAETRRISMMSAFFLGSIAAAAGLQALNQLVAVPPTDGTHLAFFRFVDILLTGAFLAGGSDGIHRFAKVYTDFMSSVSQKQEADAMRHRVEGNRQREQLASQATAPSP